MTSAPSPPNRRRRRVVVAIVVLALLSAATWWYWARGDARFVGVWSVTMPHTLGEFSRLSLRQNGWGFKTCESAPFMAPGYFRWRVADGCLYVGEPPGSIAGGVTEFASRAATLVEGNDRIKVRYQAWPILMIADNKIALRNPRHGRPYEPSHWILQRQRNVQ
jgi:hypothetical protein